MERLIIMKNQNLVAIIGDIIDSRNIEDRNKIQTKLNKVLKEVNIEYEEYIVSKWTITLGDEFQVLIKPNLEVFKMLDYISYKMYPTKIRFGIGLGEIYTDINYEKSIGADGPAYWNARDAIEFIHNNNNYGSSKISFKSKNKNDEIINNLIYYTDWMKENWTDTQKEVLYTLLENNIYSENFKQKLLAKELDISESAMSKRVRSSGIRLYLSSRNSIAKEIARQEEVKSKTGPFQGQILFIIIILKPINTSFNILFQKYAPEESGDDKNTVEGAGAGKITVAVYWFIRKFLKS